MLKKTKCTDLHFSFFNVIFLILNFESNFMLVLQNIKLILLSS